MLSLGVPTIIKSSEYQPRSQFLKCLTYKIHDLKVSYNSFGQRKKARLVLTYFKDWAQVLSFVNL
jgi:hypothetical protein